MPPLAPPSFADDDDGHLTKICLSVSSPAMVVEVQQQRLPLADVEIFDALGLR